MKRNHNLFPIHYNYRLAEERKMNTWVSTSMALIAFDKAE